MAKGPKIIDVGDGYAVQFLQRAQGQETPYWIGLIYKDGGRVGSFKNSGTGGMTFIDPAPVRQAFAKLVKDSAPEVDLKYEPEEQVIYFAEAKGYMKRCAGITLAQVVRATAKDLATP